MALIAFLIYQTAFIFEYRTMVEKVSQYENKAVGRGGIFHPSFGVFILTLPWSLVLEIKIENGEIEADKSASHSSTFSPKVRIGDYLDAKNTAIVYTLFVLFGQLNAVLLETLFYGLAALGRLILK